MEGVRAGARLRPVHRPWWAFWRPRWCWEVLYFQVGDDRYAAGKMGFTVTAIGAAWKIKRLMSAENQRRIVDGL